MNGEQIDRIKQAWLNLTSALEKAQQKGVFNLQESAVVWHCMLEIAKVVEKTTVEKTPEKNEEIKSSEL